MSLTVLIKPSSGKCNLACKYCFYRDETESRAVKDYGFMSRSTAENIIRRAFAADEREIVFAFQGGEPMLIGLEFYEYFVERVDRYKKKKSKIFYTIQTNGTLITRAFAAFFKKYGFLVGVSLDGNAATNDGSRRYCDDRPSHQKVLEGIGFLESERVSFNVVAVVHKGNYRKIVKTYRYFADKGFGYLQFIPCIDPVNKKGGYMLNDREMLWMLTKLFDVWLRDILDGKYVSIRNFDNYVRILQKQQPENCAMCGVCGNYFTIEADGSIFPCDFYCLDEWYLGNINEYGFDGVDRAKARSFVEESKTVPAECRRCRYFSVCRNGCKRDRIDGLNRYCGAYRKFFAKREKQLLLLAQNVK